MSSEAKRFGAVVKRRRVDLGHTHESLAHAGGPSDTTLSKIESVEGVRSPRGDTFRKLDTALGWTRGSARRLWVGGEVVLESTEPNLDTYTDADLMRVLLRRAELREEGGSGGDATPSTRAGSAGARKGVRARTNRQGPHLREVDASSKVKDTSGQGNESP